MSDAVGDDAGDTVVGKNQRENWIVRAQLNWSCCFA